MKKLSSLEAPALAGIVREKNALAAVAEIQNCIYSGADMIDLHVSCLNDTSVETLKSIISTSKLPVLALNYNFGCEPFDEEARMESMLRAIEAGAAALDMQGYSFDAKSKGGFYGEDKYSFTKNSPREVVTDSSIIDKQCALIEKVHAMNAEVLLSCHPAIVMNAEEVVELALFLEKRGPDIIKIVTEAKNDEHMIEAIRAMTLLKKELKTPVSYHAGGSAGMLTRIINPILGGQIAFCTERFKEGSVREQPDLRSVRAIVDNMKRIL